MLDKIVKLTTKALKNQKNYLLGVEKKLSNYIDKTDTQLKTLLEHDHLRIKYIDEKLDVFLGGIDERAREENNRLLEDISNDKEKLFEEVEQKVQQTTNEAIKETQKFTKDEIERLKNKSKIELESTEKNIKITLKNNLEIYTQETTKKLYDTLKEKLASIPKAKDGKDAEIDYDAIGKMIAKEISSNKFVKDIEFIQNTNELKIIYTDGTSKKLQLPVSRKGGNIGTFIGGSSSSGGFDVNSVIEITEILNTDFVLVMKDGKISKINIDNFVRQIFTIGTLTNEVTYNGQEVTYNGEAVTYN
jgi:cell division septum initiation protein DivIVA